MTQNVNMNGRNLKVEDTTPIFFATTCGGFVLVKADPVLSMIFIFVFSLVFFQLWFRFVLRSG